MKRIWRIGLVSIFTSCAVFWSERSLAALNVVATTSDIGALVRAVAGDLASVDVIAKGSQDPHYIEPKPSFMTKLSRADLLVANGLSLETGWLPNLVQGARNPKVRPGAPGFLELGRSIEPLELPSGKLTRAMGDVHPEGNPHFTLDPSRVGALALVLAEKMAELDPANKEKFLSRARGFQADQEERTKKWRERIKKTGIKRVITYHPSLNYFLNRFDLAAAAYLEPKPGIPPTAQHVLSVIETAKREKVTIILIDNFFDSKIGDRVAKDVPSLRVKSVGIAVDSEPGLATLSDVTEQLVAAIEGGK